MTTYSDRLYNHFQREKTAFNRMMLLTISSCIFLFFVVQPYLATQSDLDSLVTELEEQSERLTGLQKAAQVTTAAIERAVDFMGDPSEYETLYKAAENWISGPDELEQKYDILERRHQSIRGMLPADLESEWERGTLPDENVIAFLRASNADMFASYQNEGDCFFRLGDQWLLCQVRKALQPARQRLDRVLYDRTASHEYTEKLQREIDAQSRDFKDGLPAAMERPGFVDWLRESLEREKNAVRRWHLEVVREKRELEKQSKERQVYIEKVESKLEEFEARREEIKDIGNLDTPLGTLPLSFHDILAVVPFLTFLAAALLLHSQRRLLGLRRQFTAAGPTSETTIEALQSTLPIVLDPAQPRSTNAAVLTCLASPAVIALYYAFKLFHMSDLINASYAFNSALLTISTLIGISIYAVSYLRMLSEWRA